MRLCPEHETAHRKRVDAVCLHNAGKNAEWFAEWFGRESDRTTKTILDHCDEWLESNGQHEGCSAPMQRTNASDS